MATRFPRLQTIFGVRPEDATVAAIDRLVDHHVEEHFDLDFKSTLYTSNDHDKTELADDVASMANLRGGVIVLGVRDENSIAVEKTPVDLSDVETLRMQNLVADRIFPRVSFTILPIRLEDAVTKKPSDRGFYLLLIPKGSLRPHASAKNERLRYPVRGQTQKRSMTESEVANEYRNRFAEAENRVERLNEIMREPVVRRPKTEAWLTLGLVPVEKGSFVLNGVSLGECQADARRRGLRASTLFSRGAIVARAAFRQIRLRDEDSMRDGVSGEFVRAELHTDGSGRIARSLNVRTAMPDGQIVAWVNAHELVFRLAEELDFLVHHATQRCGCLGDALLQATLRVNDAPRGTALEIDLQPKPPPVVEPIPVSTWTVVLDEFAEDPKNLLKGVRSICSDFFGHLGVADVGLVDESGGLPQRWWDPTSIRDLALALGTDEALLKP